MATLILEVKVVIFKFSVLMNKKYVSIWFHVQCVTEPSNRPITKQGNHNMRLRGDISHHTNVFSLLRKKKQPLNHNHSHQCVVFMIYTWYIHLLENRRVKGLFDRKTKRLPTAGRSSTSWHPLVSFKCPILNLLPQNGSKIHSNTQLVFQLLQWAC